MSEELFTVEAGTLLIRIETTEDEAAPCYPLLSQEDLDASLNGCLSQKQDAKTIRTFDAVKTTNSGDVIFSLITGKAAVTSDSQKGFVFSQNFVRIDPSQKLDPQYLTYLLNESKSVRSQIIETSPLLAVTKVSVRDLRDMKIPHLPPLEKQRQIGKAYFDLKKLACLQRRKSELLEQMHMEALKQAAKEA